MDTRTELRVYAVSDMDGRPQWFTWNPWYKAFMGDEFSQLPGELTVVDHDGNCPEAVAIIDAATRKGGHTIKPSSTA